LLLIGFALAVFVTAAVLTALFTDIVPLSVIAVVGGLGMAVLALRDLQDGDGEHSSRGQPQPKVAQVKRNKQPEPRS